MTHHKFTILIPASIALAILLFFVLLFIPGPQAERDSNTASQAAGEPLVLKRLAPYLAENEDLAGWIYIENSPIDYPVVNGIDNEFYLNHGFNKEEKNSGTLFLDMEASILDDGSNWIIYGHHMKDRTMFGSLMNYKDQEYFDTHKYIEFDTLYEEGLYEVFAVIESQVYRKSDDVFKYYKYTNVTSEEAFTEYVTNIRNMSICESDLEVSWGDRLITLSTCSYQTENGRLAIIAKKVGPAV